MPTPQTRQALALGRALLKLFRLRGTLILSNHGGFSANWGTGGTHETAVCRRLLDVIRSVAKDTKTRECVGPCKRTLAMEKFATDNRKATGRASWCQECMKSRDAQRKSKGRKNAAPMTQLAIQGGKPPGRALSGPAPAASG
jgi:hypothetical protein